MNLYSLFVIQHTLSSTCKYKLNTRPDSQHVALAASGWSLHPESELKKHLEFKKKTFGMASDKPFPVIHDQAQTNNEDFVNVNSL